MKSTENKETVCPMCENHCPSDQLRCLRGQAHFGNAGQEPTSMAPDDTVLLLLRKCGHYLHHNGAAANSQQLLSALSDEEKHEMIALLTKCAQDWE